jgi:lipopolysaccharide assembly outer membrane protein LptD (OstA)
VIPCRLKGRRGRGVKASSAGYLRESALILGILLAAGSFVLPAPADTSPDAPGGERKALSLPGGEGSKTLELTAGAGSVFGKDELLLKEYVDIHYGDLRLQADTVRYLPATKECFAEGNVIVDSGPTRITARKVDYNLGSGTGVFYDARGYAEPSFYFEAAQVQKLGEDRYLIIDAKFTTCTQPVPYWSFRVSRGTIHVDNYAYLHNVSFRVQKVPVFYSPYLVWPIKTDRATGLLFPEFGFSRRRGFVLSNALYWAMRRNMDATFFLDYYAQAGVGEGLEYRYVPSAHGKGEITGSFIKDQITETNRYYYNLNHRQDLPGDLRLVASLNQVSDFDYFLDFQRDLRLSTNPVVLSSVYLTRNWNAYSGNFRAEQRKQIFSVTKQYFPVGATPAYFATDEVELTSRILPRAELRGNKQQLGNSPLYFSFQTSLDSFEKETTLYSANYQRFDLFPVFSAPLRLAPWLDVNPSVGLRDTYYTKRLGAMLTEDANGNGVPDPGEDTGLPGYPGTAGNGILDTRVQVLNSDFVRKVLQGSLEINGPRFSRIFDTPDSTFSPMYKNTIEPRIVYLYTSKVEDPQQVIQFDEKDAVAGNQNAIQYSLVTRLFAKRPGVTPTLAQPSQGLAFPQHLTPPPEEGEDLSAPTEAKPPEQPTLSPVEIASFQLSQTYSLLGPLSRRTDCTTILGVPVCQETQTSHLSSLDGQFHYNPTLFASVDLRAQYDILYNAFKGASLSANFRSSERGFVDVTWFYNAGLEPFSVDSSQIGLLGEGNLLNRKLVLGFQGNYDVVQRNLQDQRYKIGYNTQCCGFTLEILDRNYQGIQQQEFRLVVNLRGIGNVLDLNSGTSAMPSVPLTF